MSRVVHLGDAGSHDLENVGQFLVVLTSTCKNPTLNEAKIYAVRQLLFINIRDHSSHDFIFDVIFSGLWRVLVGAEGEIQPGVRVDPEISSFPKHSVGQLDVYPTGQKDLLFDRGYYWRRWRRRGHGDRCGGGGKGDGRDRCNRTNCLLCFRI